MRLEAHLISKPGPPESIAKEPILKHRNPPIGPFGLLLLCAVTLSATLHCDAPPAPSAANPVRTIEIKALDKLISDPSFHGLVVVMAAWCAPCREEFPILADLYRKYEEKGIRIVAVGIDNGGPREIQPLVDKLKIPFPVYWAGPAATRHYKIAGIPTLMVINRGRQVEKIPGLHPHRFIEGISKDLLDGKKPASEN